MHTGWQFAEVCSYKSEGQMWETSSLGTLASKQTMQHVNMFIYLHLQKLHDQGELPRHSKCRLRNLWNSKIGAK